jgi:hypothetical protein
MLLLGGDQRLYNSVLGVARGYGVFAASKKGRVNRDLDAVARTAHHIQTCYNFCNGQTGIHNLGNWHDSSSEYVYCVFVTSITAAMTALDVQHLQEGKSRKTTGQKQNIANAT